MAKLEAEQIVTPNAENIAAAAKAASSAGGAPVHLWNPPFCGDLDMEIKRDGTWFYEGTPIGRIGLVKLFASVLKLEDGKFFLVTPAEKVGIRVEDAPFVAVDVTAQGTGNEQLLTFRTNVDQDVSAGPDNPLRIVRDAETGEPSPYVMVRNGLEALVDRKSFYRLVDLGQHREVDGERWFGLWSGGAFFPVIPSRELPEA
ncbi:MAG: DUF1285 domain-containing protein [Oceanicola sp.]|jgi:hypothetical protein|nr:DUF1285 domain-containing protein [Oceanicola sp.]